MFTPIFNLIITRKKKKRAYNLSSCFQFCIISGIGPLKLLSLILLQTEENSFKQNARKGYITEEHIKYAYKSVKFSNPENAIGNFPDNWLEDKILWFFSIISQIRTNKNSYSVGKPNSMSKKQVEKIREILQGLQVY